MTGTLRSLLILTAVASAGSHRAPAADRSVRETRALDEVHVVRQGETLSEIAAATLGSGALWPVLYRANRDQIKDPARLYPGQKLTIPEVDAAERSALGENGERGPVGSTQR